MLGTTEVLGRRESTRIILGNVRIPKDSTRILEDSVSESCSRSLPIICEDFDLISISILIWLDFDSIWLGFDSILILIRFGLISIRLWLGFCLISIRFGLISA